MKKSLLYSLYCFFWKKIVAIFKENSISLLIIGILIISNICWKHAAIFFTVLQTNYFNSIILLFNIGVIGISALIFCSSSFLKKPFLKTPILPFLIMSGGLLTYFCSSNMYFPYFNSLNKIILYKIIFIIKILVCYCTIVSLPNIVNAISIMKEKNIRMTWKNVFSFVRYFVLSNTGVAIIAFTSSYFLFKQLGVMIPKELKAPVKEVLDSNIFVNVFYHGEISSAIVIGIGLTCLCAILKKLKNPLYYKSVDFVLEKIRKMFTYLFKTLVKNIMVPWVIFASTVVIFSNVATLKQLGIFVMVCGIVQFITMTVCILITCYLLKINVIVLLKKLQSILTEALITGNSATLFKKVIDVSNEELGVPENTNFILEILFPFIMHGTIAHLCSIFTFIMVGTGSHLTFLQTLNFLGQAITKGTITPGITGSSFFVAEKLLINFQITPCIWGVYPANIMTGRFAATHTILQKFLHNLVGNKILGTLDESLYDDEKKQITQQNIG